MRKTRVEDGLTLSLSSLLEKGALVPGSMTRGAWLWTYPGQEAHARIGYVGNMVDLDAATVTLDYRVDDQPMRYPVRLVSTVPRFGDRRWWFVCPLARKDGGPPRRVANHHQPPGQCYFGSRDAYGLTYQRQPDLLLSATAITSKRHRVIAPSTAWRT